MNGAHTTSSEQKIIFFSYSPPFEPALTGRFFVTDPPDTAFIDICHRIYIMLSVIGKAIIKKISLIVCCVMMLGCLTAPGVFAYEQRYDDESPEDTHSANQSSDSAGTQNASPGNNASDDQTVTSTSDNVVVPSDQTSVISQPDASQPVSGETIVITIDAGHGGKDSGAVGKLGRKKYCEKDLNLAIAVAIRDELLTYQNVEVHMTRATDKYLSLSKRVAIAKKYDSDLLYSVHIDWARSKKVSGAHALISAGQYRKSLAKVTKAIGAYSLANLNVNFGIKNGGYLKRYSSRLRYPNKKRADYYAIVRQGTLVGIPSMIMEHGYISNKADLRRMDTDDELKAIGISDATAIAQYYGLVKK